MDTKTNLQYAQEEEQVNHTLSLDESEELSDTELATINGAGVISGLLDTVSGFVKEVGL